MSLALEKFSYKESVGSVGMAEFFDYPHVLKRKIKQLAEIIKKSKHLVVFTGAGISTSCGIPDFRGPNGVWTLQSKGLNVPEPPIPFHRAMPGITHMALVGLMKADILKFVISQNVDSLHLRSGIPREKLAELHGNAFRENCSSCGAEYLHDFEINSIGMKYTPRRCTNNNCQTKLQDTVVDFQGALPPKERHLAEEQCQIADVVLCLGTSLQVTPAANIPLKCLRGGGKIVIVNIQATPKDEHADLIIHGPVDQVIKGLMHQLELRIPPYVRVDFVQVMLSEYSQQCATKVQWALRVNSVSGFKGSLPLVKSVEVSFLNMPNLKQARLLKEPFHLKRAMIRTRSFTLVLKLNCCDGCSVQSSTVHFPVNFQVEAASISHDKDAVVQMLTNDAIESGRCGRAALVERYTVPKPRKQVGVFAVSTNVVRFDNLLEYPQSSLPKSNTDQNEEAHDNMSLILLPPKKRKHYI